MLFICNHGKFVFSSTGKRSKDKATIAYRQEICKINNQIFKYLKYLFYTNCVFGVIMMMSIVF